MRVTGANHSECGDRFTVRANTELLFRVPRVCTARYVSWVSVMLGEKKCCSDISILRKLDPKEFQAGRRAESGRSLGSGSGAEVGSPCVP